MTEAQPESHVMSVLLVEDENGLAGAHLEVLGGYGVGVRHRRDDGDSIGWGAYQTSEQASNLLASGEEVTRRYRPRRRRLLQCRLPGCPHRMQLRTQVGRVEIRDVVRNVEQVAL